jgi:choice-of-anchor B domain-containing protein
MINILRLIVLISLLPAPALAQLNLNLVANLQYGVSGNDIWGWVAPDGTEYALMGLRNGISIVSLADPTNPVEVAFVPGENSTWRDIKTWEHYAYVTTDQPGTTEGLVVINLAPLPDSVTWTNWRPELSELGGTLYECHNLYIDEFGYAYLAGCNLNAGGVLFVNLYSDPANPVFAGYGPPVYSHDVYVRNNLLYSSEILLGQFGVYDVSDKSNPVLLGGAETPARFTHNAWLSDDAQVLFTTDERANAPVTSYDVSDLQDIRELDQFRPASTLGEGVIPHNVHVWNDYLVISYYTDGCVIVDASRPENLVKVGQYDTFNGPHGGFNGAWGAYPFLPSGLVLVSDIQTGLYVLEPEYLRASFLEGTVLNEFNGQPLSDVQVQIVSSQANQARSNILGQYKTGLPESGSKGVLFTKDGFFPELHIIELAAGELRQLDVSMTPYGVLQGTVLDTKGQAIPLANVFINGNNLSVTVQADSIGFFQFFGTRDGSYTVVAGQWGYEYIASTVIVPQTEELVLQLSKGYQDDFLFDYGWTRQLEGISGSFERAVPLRVLDEEGNLRLPGNDVTYDYGNQCYVTGNDDDRPVQRGASHLYSPWMNLSNYTYPVLEYNRFLYKNSTNPDDYLEIAVNNGREEIIVERLLARTPNWGQPVQIPLAPLLEPGDSVQVRFSAHNHTDRPNLVEAAVDAFRIMEGNITVPRKAWQLPAQLQVLPNPMYRQGALEYQVDLLSDAPLLLEIFNAQGQQVEQRILPPFPRGRVEFTLPQAQGVYFLRLGQDGQWSEAVKLINF